MFRTLKGTNWKKAGFLVSHATPLIDWHIYYYCILDSNTLSWCSVWDWISFELLYLGRAFIRSCMLHAHTLHSCILIYMYTGTYMYSHTHTRTHTHLYRHHTLQFHRYLSLLWLHYCFYGLEFLSLLCYVASILDTVNKLMNIPYEPIKFLDKYQNSLGILIQSWAQLWPESCLLGLYSLNSFSFFPWVPNNKLFCIQFYLVHLSHNISSSFSLSFSLCSSLSLCLSVSLSLRLFGRINSTTSLVFSTLFLWSLSLLVLKSQ